MMYHSVTDGYSRKHSHLGHEMLFIQSGEGVYLAGERVIPVRAPALVSVEGRVPHGPHIRGRYERWNVVALPELFTEDSAAEALEIVQAAFRAIPGGVAVVSLSPREAARVEALFRSLGEELRSRPAPFSAEILCLKLAELAFLFRRFHEEEAKPPEVDTRTPKPRKDDKVGDALRYIEAHLDEELNADTLAAALHYSRAQVYRLIREGTGHSLGQYIRQRRIAKARRLLEVSDLSVTDIARSVGMPHLPHFCKVFREMTQFTPTEYRMRHR